METYGILNTILVTFIEAAVVLYIFSVLNNKPAFIFENKVKSAIFCILYTIIFYWGLAASFFGLQIILLVLFAIIALSFILNVKLYYSLLSCLMIFVYLAVVKFMVLLGFILVTGQSPDAIAGGYFSLLNIGFISVLIEILLYYPFLRKFSKFTFETEKRENNFWSTILLHIFVVAVFIIRLNSADTFGIPEIYIFEGMFTIAYLLCVILSYWDFADQRQIRYLHTRYKVQQSYVNSLEKTIDIIRRIKHDFLNQLNTINAYATIDEPDSNIKIQECIERAAGRTSKSFTYFDTGNDYLNVLLAVKNNMALEKDITMNVDIKSSLAVAEISDSDLTCVIENILENAFETLEADSKNTEKKIDFEAKIVKNKIQIKISNNGPKIEDSMLSKIFDPGFSTKEGKSEELGFGLYMAKKIVDENNGEIIVDSNSKRTSFTVLLKV